MGRCQPERNFRTIRGFEHYYPGQVKIADLFLRKNVQGKPKPTNEKQKRREEKEGENQEPLFAEEEPETPKVDEKKSKGRKKVNESKEEKE